MNFKQYNNVIEYTLKHDAEAQTDDSLKTARTIFNNMGVALPNGSMKEVYETIKTDNYMGWKSCSMQEAQKAANKGVAAIGINENRIVILSANDDEEPVAETASVMSLTENTSAYAVDGLAYYSYSYSTTTVNTSDFYFMYNNMSVDLGWKGYNEIRGSSVPTVRWTSDNTNVASVDSTTGEITANKAGFANITATSTSNSDDYITFEIWVKGIKPVILIHGRVSNSFRVWGAGNKIFSNPLDNEDNDNNHYDPELDAFSEGDDPVSYISKSAQDIWGYRSNLSIIEDGEAIDNYYIPAVFNGEFDDGKYVSEHPEGGNLAYYLKTNGYKENINLFVFNYPNKDAVVHSAEKLEAYINNLANYVRNFGSMEMKASFFPSKYEYETRQFRINLVGHSMGGLVARYYIENLGYQARVDKLITICTPHWGSGYADFSNNTSAMHVLCDHDLDRNSAMYGGTEDDNLDEGGCHLLNFTDNWTHCTNEAYELTDELQYSEYRLTDYYAIAGIDYNAALLTQNNFPIDIDSDIEKFSELSEKLQNEADHKLCKLHTLEEILYTDDMDIKSVGDNIVGFLSQIGWTETARDSTEDGKDKPSKRIPMHKIFVNIDTNGGNLVWDHLHGKMPHRECVMEKVLEYLAE